MSMRNGSKWSSLALLVVLAACTASAQQAHPVDDKLSAERRQDRRRMADGCRQLLANALQPAETDRRLERQPPWARLVLRHRLSPRHARSISGNFKWHSLRYSHLGRRSLQWTHAPEKRSGAGIRNSATRISRPARWASPTPKKSAPAPVSAAAPEIAASPCMAAKCTSARSIRGSSRSMRKQAK